MADGGYASQYLPALSRLLGEVEQPTNTQALVNPQFGGSPEQLMGIFQSPETQQAMQKLGVHFDPDTLRQSPFFSNQFMQAHPGVGGFLNRGMANMAATPEAPLVSGAGSGLSRFSQGAAGGPEMLRQYQIRQMMAPFQAMGAMIPGQEFQRKQHLLELLQKMEEDRAEQSRRAEAYRESAPAGRLQSEIYAPPGAPGYFTREAAQAAGPMGPLQPHSALEQTIFPQAFTGQGGFQAPTSPAQPGGPLFHPYDQQAMEDYLRYMHPERVGAGALAVARAAEQEQETAGGMAPAKVDTEKAKKGYYEGRGEEARAKGRAAEKLAAIKGERREDYEKWSKEFDAERDKWAARDQHISELEAGGASAEAVQKMRAANDSNFEEAKKAIDRARGTAGGPKASVPWTRPGPVTPGAKPAPAAGPGGAQAGGADAQRSEGTAPQQFPPDAQVDDAGNVFDSKGNYLGRSPQAAPPPAPAPKQ